VAIHGETPLNVDSGITNERQDDKIGIVGVKGYFWEGGV
jgi:hypothetical protein